VAPIWRRFMEAMIAGQPVKNFPDPNKVKWLTRSVKFYSYR
jgi:membrane carboxypeptidase/penicillin-binding protein